MIVLDRFDGFVRCEYRVCEKSVINERRRVAVAPFGMLWRGGCIFDYGYFEALLEQFPQMRFDAHVGEHPTKNDIADLAFAELLNFHSSAILSFRFPKAGL